LHCVSLRYGIAYLKGRQAVILTAVSQSPLWQLDTLAAGNLARGKTVSRLC